MQIELYAVPVGVSEGQIFSSIEIYVPDLNLLISNSGSHGISEEESKERYNVDDNQYVIKIGTEEIPKDMENLYIELKSCVELEEALSVKIFDHLGPIIEQKSTEIQSQPKIIIPDINESKLILET